MTLADLGEFGFLDRLAAKLRAPRAVEVGVGDDCAVVRNGRRRWLLTTDTMIEGVHFRLGWDTTDGLGRKAFAVNASDVAAMGGEARYALVSVAVPIRTGAAELERFHRGFVRAAAAAGCALVGGNLSAAPRWMITVTLVGETAYPPLLRAGAKPGDRIYVSGTLGGAAFARSLLLAGRRPAPSVSRPWRRPTPRLALGRMLAARGLASAAIDVSDGLIQDLGHVCRASGVGAEVGASRVPLAAALRGQRPARRLSLGLAGGEDYELLFTVPRAQVTRLERSARRSGRRVPRLTAIGEIVSGAGVSVVDERGGAVEIAGGFDHFRR